MGKIESNASWVRWSLAVVCVLSLIVVVAASSENSDLESINMTSSGVAWVTTMDVDELEQQEEKVALVEQAEADQEFSSMESILHWAIGMPTNLLVLNTAPM